MRQLLSTRAAAFCSLSALAIVGCNSLTDVDTPDVVLQDQYETAAGASALALGGLKLFIGVFGGGDPGYSNVVGTTGQMADELRKTGGLDRSWDERNSEAAVRDPYGQLNDARQRFLSALGTFQRAVQDSTARIGEVSALTGYISVFLGEIYCSGVPLSSRDASLAPVYGRSLTTAEIFDSAAAAFDAAIVTASDSARIVYLARVGKGRALLNQGRYAEAAQAVASVPTDYVYNVKFSGDEVLGDAGVSGFFNRGGPTVNVTIPEQEGTNGINWRSASDPRVVLVRYDNDVVSDDTLYAFAPYQSETAPIRLAGGIEARLIEAEAALQAGDVVGWLTIHNTIRMTVPGLGPLADPGTPAGRVDLHFRERAFWLFLTGHRLGDLRRLVRQYGRSQESVFPVGIWREGIPYGTATNMAPPETERLNPHYKGCLNRDA